MPRVTVIPSTIDTLTKAPLFVTKKKKVCAYARVSTDSEDQENSFEAQQRAYTKLINDNPDWELIEIYADKGISGTSLKNRDEFKRMVADAKAGKIDLIINKSISRFGRNTVDTIKTIRELKEAGVEVFFEKENISTFDGKGELILTIMASLAQEESRSISENVKMGRRWAYQQGKVYIPFKSFLGYKKGEDGEIIIDENQAETVKLIYRLYLIEGKTCSGIADYLNERGIKTALGKEWRKTSIEHILKNEKYKGDALLQKGYVENFLEHKVVKNNGVLPQYYVENSHPAIIEREMWEQVQYEIKRREKIGASYSPNDIFSSKLICEDCGGFYGRKVWHANSKYENVIYRCNGKYDKKHSHICKTPHLTESEVKEAFIKAYNIIMADKEFIIRDIEELITLLTDTADIDEKMLSLEAELNTVDELAKKLIEEKSKDPDICKNYEKLYAEYDRRFSKAKKDYDALKEEKELRLGKKEKMVAYLITMKGSPDSLLAWDDATWKLMVESAVVHRDKTITFKFHNGREIRV